MASLGSISIRTTTTSFSFLSIPLPVHTDNVVLSDSCCCVSSYRIFLSAAIIRSGLHTLFRRLMTADQSDCRDQRLDGDFGLRDENVDLLRAKAAEQKKDKLGQDDSQEMSLTQRHSLSFLRHLLTLITAKLIKIDWAQGRQCTCRGMGCS